MQLGFRILGLCWKFLEKPSVNFTLVKLVRTLSSIFGRSSRLNLRVIFTSCCVVLRLCVKQKLSRCNLLANATHFTTLMEQLKALSLILTVLSMSDLS